MGGWWVGGSKGGGGVSDPPPPRDAESLSITLAGALGPARQVVCRFVLCPSPGEQEVVHTVTKLDSGIRGGYGGGGYGGEGVRGGDFVPTIVEPNVGLWGTRGDRRWYLGVLGRLDPSIRRANGRRMRRQPLCRRPPDVRVVVPLGF